MQPQPGETIAADGRCAFRPDGTSGRKAHRVLRGSYQLESDNPHSEPHPAIMLVSAYIVERGLILEPVRCGLENQRSALPCRNLFSAWHSKVWCLHNDTISTKKTCQVIVSSGNDYIGALKGNQSGLLSAFERQFQPEQTFEQINKGHGR